MVDCTITKRSHHSMDWITNDILTQGEKDLQQTQMITFMLKI